MCQITFSVIPSPQTDPFLVTQRKIRPWVIAAELSQRSTAALTHSGTGTVRIEGAESFSEDWPSEFPLSTVIDLVRRQAPEISQVALFKQTLTEEGFRIDEVGVAGKRGKALIRGISEACWTEGTDLPVFHPGLGQKINEVSCFASEGTDSGRARKGRGVQEDACRSVLQPLK